MKVSIPKGTRPFTTRGNRLLTAGEFDLPDRLANELIDQGLAKAVKSDAKAEDQPKTATAPKSDIPADFPERDKLIGAGITTVAQLKSDGIAEKIGAIEGVDISKIAIAIAELK